ncbi:putative membrane protein [Campylobacter jejuni subsp. jejuni D42a]|nr:putative membrane protein [Campylobacter jejuni subsp. jejuni D42a]
MEFLAFIFLIIIFLFVVFIIVTRYEKKDKITQPKHTKYERRYSRS